MISNYSSLIEFLAAVYVTMGLDNTICSKFWTPNYYVEIAEEFKKYQFPNSELFFEKFRKKIEAIYRDISLQSRKKGCYMLAICVLLLIACGFEERYSNLSETPLFGSILLSCIFMFANKYVFKKWKYLLVCIMLTILAYCFLMDKTWISEFSFIAKNHVGDWMFVLFILGPILHQLYINWLYSSVYKGFMKYKAETEYDIYISALEAIEKGDKKKLNSDYWNEWTTKTFENKDADKTSKSLYNVLCIRLEKSVRPNSWCLMFSLLRSKLRNKQVNTATISSYRATDYSALFQEYEKFKKTNEISLKSYCSMQGISFQQMVKVARQRKKKEETK